MMNKTSINLKLIGMFLFALCACTQERALKETVDTYYKHYRERADIEAFMEFYDDSVSLEDMLSGKRLEGKQALKSFFDWNNPSYKKLHQHTLIIEEQIIENNRVVSKGYFTPFKWGDKDFEAMQFTTILTFNNRKKIVKQVDWINYPNELLDYEKRKNSNMWIK